MLRFITKKKLTRMLNAAHHAGYLLGVRYGWEARGRLVNRGTIIASKAPTLRVEAEVEEILSRWGF